MDMFSNFFSMKVYYVFSLDVYTIYRFCNKKDQPRLSQNCSYGMFS